MCSHFSPKTPPTASCEMGHTGTFNALAYVVASKRDKKFITCSNDAHFAAVSDCNRHVPTSRGCLCTVLAIS